MKTTKEPDSCWACDNWIYTLFFWNKQIGDINDVHSIKVSEKTKKKAVKKIRLRNKETYLQSNTTPVLFSNITNWKPKPFMKMLDFLNLLSPEEPPNRENQIDEEAKEKFKLKNFDTLNTTRRL